MTNKNLSWTKEEVCKLFEMAQKAKSTSKPLYPVFREFAQSFARKPSSVRNFYYEKLKFFEQNPQKCKEYGINLIFHKKHMPVFFTPEEENIQMGKVQKLVDQGHSVRSACNILSGGDITKMLRLQNKYRTQKKLPESPPTNVFVMPQRKHGLSDNEINSLFLGLIKLVKKNTEEKAQQSLKTCVLNANYELRKSIKALADSQREVENLRKKFEILTSEKQKLTKQIELLRSENASLLAQNGQDEKLQNLKSYMKKLSKQDAIKT